MVFNKLVSFQLDYAPQYHLSKYISSRSGLQLIHINNKASPLVQGYFAVATECATDSGVPHTLEHLIFMGSHKHPYKGLLDTAGNLCMSSTNAWTATDQTVYTLTSAGWPGFKKLLPVYLDHILNPTLTDQACTTEVYHVDPEDLQEKGVVFSEMEGIESQSWFITMLEKQRKLFKQGSGYRSETGGLTSQLRELTNDEIRKFHKAMYSPENLCLIVSGNVPEDELLRIVSEFDLSLPKFEKERFRPFLDTQESQIPPRRDEITLSEAEFPETDETQGEILMSWIAEPYKAHLNDLAVSLLMDYFTETALAPFNSQLVEVEDPLANFAEYWTDDYMRTIINLNFHGVPVERLLEAKDKILEILSTHKIDISRMKQVIDNGKWDYVMKCEKNGLTILSQVCITDFLYGDENGKILEDSLKDLSDFDKLSKWTLEQWQDLLGRVFIENKPVIVLGKPSAVLYQTLEEQKQNRTKDREVKLGSEGKAHLKKRLEDALAHNGADIPSNLLNKFVVEDPEKSVTLIHTNGCSTVQTSVADVENEWARKILDTKPESFPFSLHFEQFPSQFVELRVMLNTFKVDDVALLPLYHVICELFSMPMRAEDGSIIGFESVVSSLKSETIDAEISMSLGNSFPDLLEFCVSCRTEDYDKAIKWIKHCLFDMIFDKKRVRVLLEKYLSSIVELKREGDLMVNSLFNRHFYSERTMKKSTDALFVEQILGDILDQIDDGKYEQCVLPKLNEMRKQMAVDFHSYHILVFGGIEKITNVYAPWLDLLSKSTYQHTSIEHVPPVPRLIDSLSPLGKRPKNLAHIITTPASESSYMTTATGLGIDMNYNHPDHAAICLAAEYLGCVEGPFWKGIRGSGLAYGANIIKMVESNAIGFSVYRGADIISCYQTARSIINDFALGNCEIDPQLVKGAVSSIINGIASSESDFFSTALMKYVDDVFKKRGPNFNRDFLKKLGKVEANDIQKVLAKYFVNIFDSKKATVFVSCHPAKLDAVSKFMVSEGYEILVEELENDSEDASDDESEGDSETSEGESANNTHSDEEK
ncbi:LANO_0A05160g1_1 [Lachancea nothofagi CBS 11611]|uniref:LANO_0A05160g1_1 n=1 Tax=Lachancea nothofagi CBS 11611 TaxID=1266666 RepID=A0A1G4IQW5_9SACH|nr:LANO_0A05160g1_1 [Lachancea nothofagi CBS 11611]